MVAKGIIERKQDIRIADRRAKVARLFGTMNERDIARELKVSKGTIDADIRFLREQGIIKEETPILLSLKKKHEMEQRREQIVRIYNENYGKITIKQIANLLGISPNIAYRDMRILRKEGKIKDFDEENAQEEEQAHDKRSPELEKRIKIIHQKIMTLYKEGKINKAKELLRLLGERINFNDEERKKYDEIMAIFNKALERQNKSQSPRKSGEKTIDDKGDER